MCDWDVVAQCAYPVCSSFQTLIMDIIDKINLILFQNNLKLLTKPVSWGWRMKKPKIVSLSTQSNSGVVCQLLSWLVERVWLGKNRGRSDQTWLRSFTMTLNTLEGSSSFEFSWFVSWIKMKGSANLKRKRNVFKFVTDFRVKHLTCFWGHNLLHQLPTTRWSKFKLQYNKMQ